MKILYIHTDVVSDEDIRNTILEMEEESAEYRLSAGNYSEELLQLLEKNGTELVISLKYIPMVSIVCNAMRVKYAAWISSSYDPEIYSCTVINPCNYFFIADGKLYEEFTKEGFEHIYYLPLGVNEKRIQEVLQQRNIEEDETVDLVMQQDIFPRTEMPEYQKILECELKDATRGYLEGCIACLHQLSGLPPMTTIFPPYIWEDLDAHLQVRKNVDSVETLAHALDAQYFNPLITCADRDIHFNALANNSYFKRTELYTKSKEYRAEKVKCCPTVDYGRELPGIARRAKINLVITDRNWKSAIPQISWDIMGAGGFLLSNVQEDYFTVFSKKCPVLYLEEREMLSRGIYYLNHAEERQKIAIELQAEVMDMHTQKRRLQEMLECL